MNNKNVRYNNKLRWVKKVENKNKVVKKIIKLLNIGLEFKKNKL